MLHSFIETAQLRTRPLVSRCGFRADEACKRQRGYVVLLGELRAAKRRYHICIIHWQRGPPSLSGLNAYAN